MKARDTQLSDPYLFFVSWSPVLAQGTSWIPQRRQNCSFSSFRPRFFPRPGHRRQGSGPTRHSYTREIVCSATSTVSGKRSILQWMTENGCKVSPAVTVVTSSGSTVPAVSVTEDIVEEKELVRISPDLCITPDVARKAFGKEKVVELGDAQVLGLFIIRETAKREESFWYPLLATLPPLGSFDHPYFWSEDDLGLLQCSALAERARTFKRDLEDDYKAVQRQIPSDLISPGDLTSEKYFWAQAVVLTLCVAIPGRFGLALVPLSNMPLWSSSSFDANAKIGSIPTGIFREPRPNIVSTRPIQKGELVQVAKGLDRYPISNADMLFHYGIVVEPEPETREMLNTVGVEFKLAEIDPFYDDKVEILRREGMPTELIFPFSSKDAGSAWNPPENLLPFIRLVCLERQDAYLLEAVFQTEVWDFMQLPVSEANERAMCETVIAACDAIMEGYPEIPEGTDLGSNRKRAACIVVNGEKEALLDAKEWFSRELQSLDAKEYYQERRLKDLDLLRPVDESEIVDSGSGSRVARAFDENY